MSADARCAYCEAEITEENWDGWCTYPADVPVCDDCMSADMKIERALT